MDNKSESQNSNGSEVDDYGREQLIAEIKKHHDEYLAADAKINQQMDLLIRRFKKGDKNSQRIKQLNMEIIEEHNQTNLTIARMKGRLVNAEKAAKVVKDQPKMITIMQHLDDPIQKRQIELVKRQMEMWKNKSTSGLVLAEADLPPLTEIFPFITK